MFLLDKTNRKMRGNLRNREDKRIVRDLVQHRISTMFVFLVTFGISHSFVKLRYQI